MPDLSLIRARMDIVGSDGQHVGAVVKLGEGRLFLAQGQAIEGEPPSVPLTLIDEVEEVVRLNAPALDVIKRYLGGDAGTVEGTPRSS